MTEIQIPVLFWVLSGSILFFVVLVWFGQIRLQARMARIERQLGGAKAKQVDETPQMRRKAENGEQKQMFQEFLAEDPSRKMMPKREQFTAFRKWRSEKGLNWTPEGRKEGKPV